MITFGNTTKKEIEKNWNFVNPDDLIFSEFDEDFYKAKDKTDLDLIKEKLRLGLYKEDTDLG